MPQVATLRFTKDYQTVVETFKGMVKNAVVTERVEDEHPVIEIEGDFSHFVVEDMGIWDGYFKFEIKDFRIQSNDDREARAILSEGIPGFGAVLFSPTIAFVYQRVEYQIVTSTVVERLDLDEEGKRTVLSRDVQESEPQFEWKDITREFAKKVHIDKD